MRIQFDAELFGAVVSRILDAERLTWAVLGARSGVIGGNLQRLIHGDGVVSFEAIMSVAAALDLPIAPFLKDNGDAGAIRRARTRSGNLTDTGESHG